MGINENTSVMRNHEPMSVRVDDDLVILNMVGDNYIAMDEIGRRIWDLIESPIRVAALCHQLSQEFEADPQIINDDVLSFLIELEREGLVLINEKPEN